MVRPNRHQIFSQKQVVQATLGNQSEVSLRMGVFRTPVHFHTSTQQLSTPNTQESTPAGKGLSLEQE